MAFLGSLANTNITGTITASQLASSATSVGVGQTWTTVYSSRSSGTEYQNTTGKPIMVNIWFVAPFTSRGQLWVYDTSGGQVIVADSDGGDYYSASAYTNHYTTISAIVPPNHYYKFFAVSSDATINGWAELR